MAPRYRASHVAMQGNLSPPQTTYPAIPDSTPLSTPPPDFSLPAYTTASPQSAFVSSLPAPRPRLDPHAPTLQDLGSVSAMRFTQAQPLPASPSHHWLPSHAYVGSIEPIMSGRAVVDRAVCHSNGLHGQYASAHQQQPQSSSFDCTERSYPAADSSLGASAAAYSDEETACNVSENPVSQQQTVNGLYGGVPAQPSPSTRYLARGNGETSLAQPELEQQARRWDVQRAEWGASQVPELRSDRGLDVTIADIGGDDALAADFVAELDHLLSADHIPNGFAAAESGSARVFAALQHAAIPICMPADIRTLCIIHRIACMHYPVRVCELALLHFALGTSPFDTPANLHNASVPQSATYTHCMLHCCTNQILNLLVVLVIFCCPQGMAMTLRNKPGATM